ncbi:carboxypeptidase-like regulatory domain-containing protein [Algoriphagus boritolerans]|uniref:carboxypeptidase-like regulatory domain-containing protein n=1 Tax=Algoriphagus boritolerans TaxID=308111 RepID=UPI000AA406F7
MKYALIFSFLFILSFTAVQAQSIRGQVQEKKEGFGFPGATVIVLVPKDSTVVSGSVSDQDGRFEIGQLNAGDYLFEVRYIGYQTISIPITIENRLVDLGIILLEETQTNLDEVVISGRRSLGSQKGDTTQFNADAFRTMKDASAQNLVEKMPSISMVDGVLQAQGENIVQILVDGKPFFWN